MDRQSIYSKYKSFYFFPAAGKYTFFQDKRSCPSVLWLFPNAPGTCLPSLAALWGICGAIGKTVMFLTVLKGHNSAVFSGLSDEHRSKAACGFTPTEEFWLRWQNYGISEQLGTPRF